MTRVSVELVPRSRSGLRAELAEVAAHLRGVDTINVPDLTRYSLRSWAGCGFARPGFAAIPHLRAVDFNPREPLPFLPLLAQHGIDEVLVITGDAPADMSARVYDVDAVDLIRRLKREAPHLRVYAGLDPYRQSFVRERDYLARKLDAGACGLFTQPFFDLRVADTWADLVPEGLPVWWGATSILTEASLNYWRARNHAVFPRSFTPTLACNRAFAADLLHFARQRGQHAYFMPVKVNVLEYLGGLLDEQAAPLRQDAV
ncbi:methylenetetrahydrofolate reductase [Deinococcus multiflagellatus]|uniref:methylenetetrahydrofolate reductase n=1 Tax=Deinococcus multiflagellatus TaxID=1656887 RepID=UPI001CCA51A4|nr:methylenetetrahydrofolate reductase [Deinococcus multiflagellatus]MBZ9712991.1 methylenetetrahydrofolate reductase [Deinococcus multiflagellatus]